MVSSIDDVADSDGGGRAATDTLSATEVDGVRTA